MSTTVHLPNKWQAADRAPKELRNPLAYQLLGRLSMHVQDSRGPSLALVRTLGSESVKVDALMTEALCMLNASQR